MAEDYSNPWGIKPGLQDLSEGLVAGKPEDVRFLGAISTVANSVGGTITVDFGPLGLQEDDVCLVFGAAFQNPSTIWPTASVTGWTTRLLKAHGSSNNEVYYGLWSKAMGSTPDTEFNMRGAPSTSNASLMVMGFRAANTSHPIAGSVAFRHESANSTWNGAPQSTQTLPGGLAIMGGKSDTSGPVTMTGGFGTVYGSSGPKNCVWGAWKPAPITGVTAGSTWSGWSVDSKSFGCVSIPIRRR